LLQQIEAQDPTGSEKGNAEDDLENEGNLTRLVDKI
jgi:hypothetical protein